METGLGFTWIPEDCSVPLEYIHQFNGMSGVGLCFYVSLLMSLFNFFPRSWYLYDTPLRILLSAYIFVQLCLCIVGLFFTLCDGGIQCGTSNTNYWQYSLIFFLFSLSLLPVVFFCSCRYLTKK